MWELRTNVNHAPMLLAQLFRVTASVAPFLELGSRRPCEVHPITRIPVVRNTPM